ncbi:MAG: sodium:proton antiporter NhaD [Gammaproteobacteria bacterium]
MNIAAQTMKHMLRVLLASACVLLPSFVLAAEAADAHALDLTTHTVGYTSLAIFAFAYILVTVEEFTHLRKSKPVIIAAGIIWAMVAYVSTQHGVGEASEHAARHNLLEYAELMLFLLVAMTYINAMEERLVFDTLRSWLVRKGFGFRALFWMTGTLAFFISPVADNLTTALLMCAVVMAVGGDNKRFVSLACINIVIAANAGGAFSPFGDITTLMVWQKGLVDFTAFFVLFIPSAVNYLVPASIMQFAVPDERPHASQDNVEMRPGAIVIVILFLLTIITAVSFHNFVGLPPVMGMLTGLGYLQVFGYILKRRAHAQIAKNRAEEEDHSSKLGDIVPFDIFNKIARAEWDTLLFFYGVVMCVGGLGYIGYLSMASEVMYLDWGPTNANIGIGVLSAIIDNIPVMFAVLTMNPEMPLGQWLLVTLTAGVGGSLLSIGSAAGVALMGHSQGQYTFFSHLRWTPVIALGFAASIWTHLWLNAELF